MAQEAINVFKGSWANERRAKTGAARRHYASLDTSLLAQQQGWRLRSSGHHLIVASSERLLRKVPHVAVRILQLNLQHL